MVFLFGDSLQVVSVGVHLVFPLLSIIEIWGQTRLFISEKTFQGPFHPWRLNFLLCLLSIIRLFVVYAVLGDLQKISSLAFLYVFDGMNYAGYQLDYVFDWTISKYPQSGSSSRPRVSSIIGFMCGEPNFGIIKLSKILSCLCVYHSQQPTPRPALDPPGPPADRAEKPTGTLMFSVSYIVGTNTKRNIGKMSFSL